MTSGNWSSAGTWTNGVPTATDNAYIGSFTPTGSASVATVTLTQDSSAAAVHLGFGSGRSGTLDLNGFTLTTSHLSLGAQGGAASLLRTGGGAINAHVLLLDGAPGVPISFSLTTVDSVNGLHVDGAATTTLQPGVSVQHLIVDSNESMPANNASVTTTTTNNVVRSVSVDRGCTLTLGANLVLTDGLSLSGILNANGHAISAMSVNLGAANSVDGGPFSLNNRGPISTDRMYVSSTFTPGLSAFDLTPDDSVGSLRLYGVNTALAAGVSLQELGLFPNNAFPATAANATIAASSNIPDSVIVHSLCTLTLGRDLTAASSVGLAGVINANGHAISAPRMIVYTVPTLGGAPAIQNEGVISAGHWAQGRGAQFELRRSGHTIGSLVLFENSGLTLRDPAGQSTGLTLANVLVSDLDIESGSRLSFELNGLDGGWVFRWANADSASNHLADIQSLIDQGRITVVPINGGSYSLAADSAYTYVNVVPVPEPSALLLSLAGAGLVAWRRAKK